MGEVRRHSIFRMVAATVMVFGLLTLAVGEGAYFYARHELERRLDANMATRMASLEREFATGGSAALLELIDRYTARGARTFGYVLTDARGVQRRAVNDVPRLAPGWGQIAFEDKDEEAVDPARTLTHRLRDGSTLTIVADRDFIEQYDFVTNSVLIVLMAVIFLFAATSAFLLERRLRQRIEGINATARAIFAGNLTERVPVSPRHDEFDAIAGTVNAMLDQMSVMLAEVRRVSSYIAHDLRAPLVRLRQHLQHGPSGAEAPDFVAIEQCEDLIRLFGVIVRMGEVDRALVTAHARPFDLSAMVATLSDAHVAVAQDCGRSLTFDVAPDIVLTGDEDLLAQLLINLIDNAFRHTPAGSHVAIALNREGDMARLSVSDDGKGIMAAAQGRSAAGAEAPALASDRSGLGLKLVQAIVAAHEGHLALLDNHPGLRAVVTLPVGRATG